MGWSHFREANGLDDDAKPAIDVSCAGSPTIGKGHRAVCVQSER